MKTTIKMVPLMGLVTLAAACMDLQVTNPNAPERERALVRGQDVEALITAAFPVWWDLQQGNLTPVGGQPTFTTAQSAWDAYADLQASHASEIQWEPRRAVINDNNYRWGDFNKQSWLQLYRAQSAIRDGLNAVAAGVQIGTGGANKQRLLAYAKLMQGLALGHIALMYDQGFVFDETTTDMEAVGLQPYDKVLAAARSKLEEARRLAAQSAFTLPSGWLGPKTYTNQDVVRISNSYEARFMAQAARNPAERARVDWAGVLTRVQQGVTADFGVELSGPGGIWRTSKARIQADEVFFGPADQSGGWQRHERGDPPGSMKTPFIVDSDDRRVVGPGGPRTNGKYTMFFAIARGDPARGQYVFTHYDLMLWNQIGTTSLGFAPDLTVQEMQYLAAEAYIRTGQPDRALPIINATRVAVGELPAATAAGVSGARCVPRDINGRCGDLLRTLMWEKQIMLPLLSTGSLFYDMRGMGTVRVGTALQFPVPQIELFNMGLPIYTTGGVGGKDAAPVPAGFIP
jgi:hypothetical protein